MLPPDLLKLCAAQFIQERSHGRIDYAKLVVFLNSTLNAASTTDFLELTRRDAPQPANAPKISHEPEMTALFRLLPPYYELPLEPLSLTGSEREILLEDIRQNVRPLDTNALKILYQQLATMDSKSMSHLPFEDIKHLLRTKGVS